AATLPEKMAYCQSHQLRVHTRAGTHAVDSLGRKRLLEPDTCDVVRTGGEWITAGGNCNTATCNTAYWSGATADGMSNVTNFMLKQFNIKKFAGRGLSKAPIATRPARNISRAG